MVDAARAHRAGISAGGRRARPLVTDGITSDVTEIQPVDSRFWLELLGYLASVLVAVSLMMSRILRLRVINLVGSLAFTLYGVLIGAYPVAAVNAFIVLINLWYLSRMLRAKEYFRILEVEPG